MSPVQSPLRLDEDITDEVDAMLVKVRQLSADAFFGEDSVQKSRERGTGLWFGCGFGC